MIVVLKACGSNMEIPFYGILRQICTNFAKYTIPSKKLAYTIPNKKLAKLFNV